MIHVKAIRYHHRTGRDGRAVIYVRTTRGGVSQYKSMKISVRADEWDEAAGLVKRHPNARVWNKRIRDEITKIETADAEITSDDGEAPTLRRLKRALASDRRSVVEFWSEWSETTYAKSRGTLARYRQVGRQLAAFAGADLRWKDVDPAFLRRWSAHLARQGKAVNTVHSNMKSLRAVYRAAIREGIASQADYPFFNFALATEETEKAALTRDEVRRLLSTEPRSVREEMARDCFALQFALGGRRVGDVLSLRWKDVSSGSLRMTTRKTRAQVDMELPAAAEAVLAKYRRRGQDPDARVLPLVASCAASKNPVGCATSKVNAGLRSLARRAGVGHVSSHTARHSYARALAEAGVHMRDAQQLLTHSSVKTTEMYMASFANPALSRINASVVD